MILFFKKNKLVILLSLLFVFYCFNYYFFSVEFCMTSIDRMSRFFGADCWRVFEDLTNYYGNHYRISVHPLMMILIFPISTIFKGVLNNPVLGMMVMISFFSVLNSWLFYKILIKLNISKNQSLVIMFFYSLSSSKIVFSAIPESFVFGQLFYLLLFLIIINIINNNTISFKESFLLTTLGVFSLATTITNYIIFNIVVIFLLIIIKNKKSSLWGVLSLAISMISFVLLVIIQSKIYVNVPSLIGMFFNNFTTQGEEIRYMDFTFSISKILTTISNFFINSFAFSEVYVDNSSNLVPIVCKPTLILNIFGTFLWGIGLMFLTIKNRLFSFFNQPHIIILCLIIALNMGLHFIYGSGEQFLYSLHYSWAIVLLLILIYNYVPNIKISKYFKYSLLTVFINNMYAYALVFYYSYKMNGGLFISFKEVFFLMVLIAFVISLIISCIKLKHNYLKLALIFGLLTCIITFSFYYNNTGFSNYTGDMNIHQLSE
ncbi:MAG: hypothetical protein RR623_06815 [Bacilli bacterium]